MSGSERAGTRYARLVARAIPLFLVVHLLLLPGPAGAQDLSDAELESWTLYVLDLERRVARSGDDRPLMLRLASAYARIGDLRRAMPALDRLADMGLDPVRLALLRGDAFLGVRMWEEACRAYLDALSRSPRQLHALSQLWRLMLQVTLARAEVPFDRAAVIERLGREGLFFPEVYRPEPDGPERSSRLAGRAAALLSARPEEAEALCLQAINLDPANAEAFATLGRAYLAQQDLEPAIGAMLVSLLLAPDAPGADRTRLLIGREMERAGRR